MFYSFVNIIVMSRLRVFKKNYLYVFKFPRQHVCPKSGHKTS